MGRRFLFTICLVLLSAFSLKAQYDGSFDAIYFNRSVDAKSESLGGTGKSIFNDSFSVHQNSSLLGFQEGYNVSYSNSSPYYALEDGRFNYIGVSVKPFNNIALGISRYTFNTGNYTTQRLSSFALIYQVKEKVSVSVNARELHYDMGVRTDEQGNFLGEAIFRELYFDVTATGIMTYSLSGADARFITGITFENLFSRSLNYDFGEFSSQIALPSILTGSINNELAWKDVSNLFLTRNLYFNIASEYQTVTNYNYRTRFSFGTQLSLNKLLEIRGGYFYETLNDMGIPGRKSKLSEFTYGFGSNIPLSDIVNLSQSITFSFNFTNMPHPLLSSDNPYNVEDFNVMSFALRIVP